MDKPFKFCIRQSVVYIARSVDDKIRWKSHLFTLHNMCCNIEMASNVRREVDEERLRISRKECHKLRRK